MDIKRTFVKSGVAATAAVIMVLLAGNPAGAHCDTLDGPVIKTAAAALDAGDVTPVLKWVKAVDEPAIKEAFSHTLLVRRLGPEAKELADHYFFEALVRIHRAGEGAPYTGIKPAGAVAPPVAAADRALETGSADILVRHAAHEIEEGIRKRFEQVVEAKKHKDESVAAGREYVEAYVIFTHYVEGLHKAIEGESAHHGGPEAGAAGEHGH